jgi:hypothetical protein
MLAEIYESGEASGVARAEVAFWYLRVAIAGDQDAGQVVVKMKQSVTPNDWSQVQKKLRGSRLDPQKVEAYLESKVAPQAKRARASSP